MRGDKNILSLARYMDNKSRILTVLGQLPLGQSSQGQLPPGKLPPGELLPVDSYPRGQLPPPPWTIRIQ